VSAVVRARELSKSYRRFSPGHRLRTLKSLFVRHPAAPRRNGELVRALREVSFDVERGEMFSVIGGNGSGKSTLLKLISGILRPSAGSLEVDGRVTALIELGAGFHPEISGRENVFIAASVLGLARREIEARYARIVEFSGLGDFLEEPVKNYSSGMYVRLGFAVAIHTDPEVLLVDEVLAVGDEAFAHRCIGKIEELLAGGRTVIFVSHALGMVEELSTRVMWLERGEARMIGEPRRVVDAYRQSVAELEGETHRARKEASERGEGEPAPGEPAGGDRWGSGAAEITAVRLCDATGRERYHFVSGEAVHFEIDAVARAPLDDFVFGVALSTPRGVEVWGTNSDLSGVRAEGFAGAGTARLVCPELRLAPGEYRVDVAVHSQDGAPYDYRRRLLAFSVTAEARGVGVYFPVHHWEFAGGIRADGPNEETER
jgi:lipopolysaccharide transport system ATP-binding protein